MKNGIQTEQEIADKINQYTKPELEKFNAILQAKYDENYRQEQALTLALTENEKQRFDMYCTDLRLINEYQAQHPNFNQQNLYLTLYKRGPSKTHVQEEEPSVNQQSRISSRYSGAGNK
ncbi:MAG: hypothetical protein JSR17_10330 [Proteobacteria bacterium]|nr:hypothetical protein [Pseudomonadota bacterium]